MIATAAGGYRIELAAERRDEAVSAWREALDIAIRIGDPDVELIRRTIAEHEA